MHNTQPEGQWLVIRPHDTMSVRRYGSGNDGWEEALRPQPSTIAGAVGAALRGEPRSVRGPIFAHDQSGLHFPCPQDLQGTQEKAWRLALQPPSPVITDLTAKAPDLRMLGQPEGVEDSDMRALLPATVLEEYLKGSIGPGEFVQREVLKTAPDPLHLEPRVKARVSEAGPSDAVTNVEHHRLTEGWAFAAHVTPGRRHRPVTEVVGTDIPFGGDRRMAAVEDGAHLAWPSAPATFPGGRVLLYVATPAVWTDGWKPPLPPHARLVGVANREPITIRSADGGGGNVMQAQAVPPGSVYYLQFPEAQATKWAHAHHARASTQATPRFTTAGFGVVLTGTWTDPSDA